MILQELLCLRDTILRIVTNGAKRSGIPLTLEICVRRNTEHDDEQNYRERDENAKHPPELFRSVQGGI